MEIMGLNDSVRRRLIQLIEERDTSVNAVATAADVSEGTLRAFLKDDGTRSMRLDTVERLASALGVNTAYLLGASEKPLNKELLGALLERLLQNLLRNKKFAHLVSQSLLRAYEAGIATEVDPNDQAGLDRVAHTEAGRLLDEARLLKVVK